MNYLMQYVANGLMVGAAYALAALGLALVLRVSRVFHLAHGGVYAIGGYTAYALATGAKCPSWVAIPVSLAVAAGAGVGIESIVYRPLRALRASGSVTMIASLGILIVIQNLLSIAFGDDTKSLGPADVSEGYSIFGARVTPVQFVGFVVAIAACSLTWVLLHRTRAGRLMRAVADDPDLACVTGIRCENSFLLAIGVASTMAGVGGILAGYDAQLNPVLGLKAVLVGVVSLIVGGKDSIAGVLMGGMFVGLVQQVAVWWLPNQWQDTVLFVILIVFLMVRPQGLRGRPLGVKAA